MVRQSFLDGMAWLAAFLGVMSLLAVAAFHFPEYLTTPRLRETYAEHQVRGLLYAGLVLATLLSVPALLFSRLKRQSLLGLCCVMLAWLAGGADVSYGDQVRDARFYISLDWRYDLCCEEIDCGTGIRADQACSGLQTVSPARD